MDFLGSVKHVFANYATFSGRAPRSEYWWWVLFAFLTGIVASILDIMLGTRSSSGAGLVSGLLNLAFLLPSTAVAARRLHDVNRSGWWQLIGITIVGLIPLLIWLCRRGDEAINNYGSDPLSGVASTPATIGRRAPSPGASGDDLEQLERLARLRDQGVLTQSEFEQRKARLLGIGTPAT